MRAAVVPRASTVPDASSSTVAYSLIEECDHGDAVGRTAPLRALALHALRASKEFATVPATLAALAAAYLVYSVVTDLAIWGTALWYLLR